MHLGDITSCVPWRHSAFLCGRRGSGRFKWLFITCTEHIQRRLWLQTAHKKRGWRECGLEVGWQLGNSSSGWKHAAWEAPAPSDSGNTRCEGGSRRLSYRGVSSLFAPGGSSRGGELSREEQEEDGRALFFGVRRRRQLRRRGGDLDVVGT